MSIGIKNKYYWTNNTDEIAISLDKKKGAIFESIDIKPYIINKTEGKILELLQNDLKYSIKFPLQKLIFILPDFTTENSIYVGGYGYKEINGRSKHFLAANRLTTAFISEPPKSFNDISGILGLTETFLEKRSEILKIDSEYIDTIQSIINTLEAWLVDERAVDDDEYQSKQDRFTIVNKLGNHLNTHNVLDTYIRYLNQQINMTDIKNNNKEWESMKHY